MNSIRVDELLAAFDYWKASDHAGVVLNAAQDMQYAHAAASFEKNIHVFSKEWKGIRSAVGAMGGSKLAVTADRPLSSGEMEFALDSVRKFDKAIFHGVSVNTRNIIEYLYRHGGPESYVVWHGSHAQLSVDSERELFFPTKRLYEKGYIRRMHIMRSGCHLLLKSWPHVLFNAPLRMEAKKACARISENGIALVPMTAAMGKNLYTNIIAAAVSEKIKIIKTYNGNDLMQLCGGKTVRFLRHDGMEGHLQVLKKCAISLNVTCVDCQPMVDLEALSAGTPAITGPLFLENHFKSDYPRITTVQNPLSSEEIVKAIGRLDAIPTTELCEMMLEYKTELLQKHIESYGNFLA